MIRARQLFSSTASLLLVTSIALAQGGRGGGPAMQLIRDGKIDEAVKMAQDQAHNSPDSAQALRSAAMILDMAGRYKEAQSYFEKAIELAPNAQAEAAARRDLANSYGFAGDCKNASKY